MKAINLYVVRFLKVLITCAFFSNSWAISIPDSTDHEGIPIYQINVPSTASAYDKINAATLRIGAEDYGYGYNFWVEYTDGKYEKGMSEALGILNLSGVILANIPGPVWTGSSGTIKTYIGCGWAPRVVFTGYWQNWVIYVAGIPKYGSDFIVTNITTVDDPCDFFPNGGT